MTDRAAQITAIVVALTYAAHHIHAANRKLNHQTENWLQQLDKEKVPPRDDPDGTGHQEETD